MKRFFVLLGLPLAGMLLLVIAGCVQEVGRDGEPGSTVSPLTAQLSTPVTPPTKGPTSIPAPASTEAPTLRVSPTATPVATKAATPDATLPPTLRPPATPTLLPTKEPLLELLLDVQAPVDGSTVRSEAVVVFGQASPGALVDIGGVAAEVTPDGRFQAEVTLAPGINILTIVASDGVGNKKTTQLNITSLALPPQPFLLLVTEPKDQSIVSDSQILLAGRTGPEAITSVKGVSVEVDVLGFFSTIVSLEPGPNIIDVVATDTDGSALSAVIAVIYRP